MSVYVYQSGQIWLPHDYMSPLLSTTSCDHNYTFVFLFGLCKGTELGHTDVCETPYDTELHEFSVTDATHMVSMKRPTSPNLMETSPCWVSWESIQNSNVLQIRSFLAATILVLSYLKCHHFLGCLVHPYCRGLQELWAEKLEVTCCWFQLWILILPVNSKFTTREQRKPTCWLEVMGATWVVSITLFRPWAIKSLLALGMHVQWGLQYSIWVCVCVCVCLSVCYHARRYLVQLHIPS